MKTPALVSLFAALAVVPGASLLAQSPVAAPPAEPVTSGQPAPKRQRAISGDVAAALAASMPKYNPPPKPKPEEENVDLRDEDKPRNGIIRLPKYVVQQKKPEVFRERDLHTQSELMDIAMQRYAGLSYVPLSGMNRGVALLMYQEDERKKNISDLKEDAQDARRSGDTAEADYIKRQTNRAFSRDGGFGAPTDK
ncbi:hypothetical protein K0B96_05375 [Horticoccus luteus]|uniref:Uncharacterized protein n=1 Tax=Horticoccus luteus TaxID=2862869 RepID=A0A8F9XMA8_9BACT|nr:hypothetical protein [Horticoccus luteus]QYM80051.1 hypothetical protein K0B96_05375 [Horticoccus luteus]